MKESYALEMIQKNKRVDGRNFEDYRKIEVVKDFAKKAEGSALVKMGQTQVLAGVKMGIGTPFPDTPNEGILIVNAEFSPMASPDFEAGPPSEDAVELARVVDRGLRESGCIEFEKLEISEGKVWSIFVDILIMNHDGNLIDAAALAAIAALQNARMPKIEDEKIVRGEYDKKLSVVHSPTTVTVCKVQNKLLVDPVLEEEMLVDAKLSVATREDGKICAMQKQCGGTFTVEEIEKIVDMAAKKGKELREFL